MRNLYIKTRDIVFHIEGCIAGNAYFLRYRQNRTKGFHKINEDAEEAALQRQREAQELAAKELEAEEVLKKAEEVLEQEAEEQADSETSE